jgi:DNA helicase II / ATP-dependent DNA helicase PcrA
MKGLIVMKLQNKTLKELYAMAKEQNITGRSKMNKEELIIALTAVQPKSQIEKAKELIKAKASKKPFFKGLMKPNLQMFASESKFVEGLNDNQKEAVLTVDGTIQICSVAGSGKTRVLTNRTAHMIKDKGINPQRIMLTTFTSKASKEMEARLEQMISKEELTNLTLGTTHSIGLSFLKEFKELTEFPNALDNLKTGLLQGWKQTKLVKDIIKQLEQKYNRSYDMKLALQQIKPPMFSKVVSAYKNDNLSPVEVWHVGGDDNNNAKVQLYKEFYNMYEYEKRKMQVIDFDDMLYLSVRLLQENKKVLEILQNRFDYIMVDEAQDNNLLQYQLVKMLAYPQYNLFLVGDDDQSMYKFRGASPESFIGFKKEYKEVKQIFLPLNYRSHKDILETANKLIHNNYDRIEKKLIPANENTSKSVFYNLYGNEDQEAEEIVREIIHLKETEENQYKDIACLFRTNAQSRAIEDQLIIKGIPYVLHGGTSFYERAEIKDLIAYLSLAYNSEDNSAFKRIYNKPNRYLGNAFYERVSTGKSHYETMKSVAHTFYKNQQQGINDIIHTIEGIKNLISDGKSLEDTLKFILNKGYKDWLLGEDFNSDADSPKLENIATLEYLLSHFDTLEEFMNHLEKVINNKKESSNSVQLMTIHKSKGLEFPTVFVMGVSENTMPHVRALEEATDNKPLEEERRLCYVAVTRAEKKCYISSTLTYNGKDAGESRFIDEMGLTPEDEVKEDKEEKTA